MKILLIEPNYTVKFPPLGLLRISSYHKKKGDYVEFVKGIKKIGFIPDKIYITTLFTYQYKETIRTVRYYKKKFPSSDVWVGGILASTRPDLFKNEGVRVHIGLLKKVEPYPPDYSLFPDWDASMTFSSRGCINNCSFCCVRTMEGYLYSRPNWIKDINPKFKKIIFLDNNWTAKDKNDWLEDIRLLKELKKKGVNNLDFNQSLDCRITNEEHFKQMKGLPISPMRFSFDHMGQDKFCQKAIKLAKKYGFGKIHVDVLYNWNDTIEDFYYRLKEINLLQVTAIPMRYVPLDRIDREYVGKNWTKWESNGINRINPYPNGQISSKKKSEFEYFFGKNAKEFKKLLNFKNINKLAKLKMSKFSRDKIWE